ncbi:MAG: hypothetical protein ACI935_002046 [Moritella dasanensis]|jgi:hypothetical protein
MSMYMIINALEHDSGRPETGFSTLLIVIQAEIIEYFVTCNLIEPIARISL